MTRTTIDLDTSVLAELRRRSRRQRKSMGQLASEILAAAMAESEGESAPAFEWVSRDLGKPKVNLEDKGSVGAILDSAS